MGQVTATTQRTIEAPAERVTAALADYETVRPTILTDAYGDYRVEPDRRVHWTLQATKKRVRDQLVAVEVDGPRIVERDANSSMVTTWTVASEGTNRSTVTVETTWDGASGVGGFFERTFAPKGLARIHDGVLARLDAAVQA
jgi:Polyketide cyclase / dehydrase and lipid transport